MQNTEMRNDSPFYSTEHLAGSACSSVSLRAIICGALVAIVTSIVLTILGSGMGLAFMSPYAGDESSIGAFTAKMAIWLIIMQWASAGLGGYIAGRLRTKWSGLHSDESFFRDTAHGFLAWTFATIFVAILIAGSGASIAAGGAKALTTISAAGAAGAGHAAASSDTDISYQIGTLFRRDTPVEMNESTKATRAETTGIFMHGMINDSLTAEDRDYVASVVARDAGISRDEASARVDKAVADVNAVKSAVLEKADKARKAASAFSIFTAISMMVGAFIASVAAAAGGCHRDDLSACNIKKAL